MPEDVYPRYEYMRGKFEAIWGGFCNWCSEQAGETPQVGQCEVTYVNNVFKDEGWSVPSEARNVFPFLRWPDSTVFLPSPATLACNLVFDIAGESGRLHVACRHARMLSDPRRELFRLDLTARGKPQNDDLSGLAAWFAVAREWIVKGFADLTDPAVQNEFWRRTE